MIELLTSEPVVASSPTQRRGKPARARPSLHLAWFVDPTTGKPAARWVADAPEPVATVRLVAAA